MPVALLPDTLVDDKWINKKPLPIPSVGRKEY